MADFAHKMTRIFYLLLLFGGIGLYVIWSAAYGTWTDIGLYSICIIMVLMGLFGTLLYKEDREEFHQEDVE